MIGELLNRFLPRRIKMLSRLYRQRRRILLCVLCFMLAAGLLFGPGLRSLGAGLAGAAFSAALIVLLPQHRRLSESAGLGLVAAALLPVLPVLLPVFWIAGTGLVYALLYSDWADRTPLRLSLDSTRTSQVGLPCARTWAALIPGEAHPDDHWTGTLIDFDRDPDDADTLYLRFRGTGGLHDEVTLTFLERVRPYRCRYHLEHDDSRGADDRMMTLSLSPTSPTTCRIESRMVQEAMPIRLAIGRWFDDAYGDELDSFAALVNMRRDWSLRGFKAAAKTLNPSET